MSLPKPDGCGHGRHGPPGAPTWRRPASAPLWASTCTRTSHVNADEATREQGGSFRSGRRPEITAGAADGWRDRCWHHHT